MNDNLEEENTIDEKPDTSPLKKIINTVKGKLRKSSNDLDKPLTPEEWKIFNKHMDKHWKEFADKVTGIDSEKQSAMRDHNKPEFEKKYKPYSTSKSPEWYNPETGKREKTYRKNKYLPQRRDYSYMSEEEREYRKPTLIGDNLVRFNDNLYEAVDPDEYNKKLEENRKNPQLPIPVNRKSPSYRCIFEEAITRKKE